SGNVLYVHRRSAIIQNGAYVGNDDGIERIDLRTGQRTRLLKDGADPSISPDGKMLALVHLKDGQIDGLWRADIDGSNAAPFLKTKDSFWYLQAPRFSPRSCQLILSAAGHTVSDAGPGAPYALPRGPLTLASRLNPGLMAPRLAHLSNPELPPYWGAAIRFLPASLLLFVVMVIGRIPVPYGSALVGAVLWGLINFGLGYALTYFGLQQVNAGTASVILATVPLFTLGL